MRLTIHSKNHTIQNILEALPKVDNTNAMRQRAMEVAVARLPEAVREMYLDPATAEYINTEYVNTCCVGYNLPSSRTANYHDLSNAIKNDEAWAALHSAHDNAKAARSNMKRELDASFRSITTDKQFKDRFPDLVKYLPISAAEVVTNLPATTSLMDYLKAAGLKVDV